MRKKILLSGLAVSVAAVFLSLTSLTGAAKALTLGVSMGEDYNGVMDISGSGITIRAGAKSSLVVEYKNEQDLERVEFKLRPAEGVKIISNNLVGREGDELTGAGSNYTIKLNETTEPTRGAAVIGVQMPTPATSSEYSVEVEATAYAKTGAKIDQKNLAVNYLVLVKNTHCDANTRVKIDTSAGKPTRYTGEALGTAYTLDTTAESIDFSLTPESAKTMVIYTPELFTLTNSQELTGGKLGAAKLEYGENHFFFMAQSECAKDWAETATALEQRTTIGINDWSEYEYGPELYVILVTREDTRSKINTLSKLTVSSGEINFRPETKNYTVKVGHGVDTLKINSSLSDSKSMYVEGGNERTIKLHDGDNPVAIKVRAENGEEETYTLNIVRAASSDNKLAKLSVNGKEIALKDNELIYSLRVENEIAVARLSAEARDAQARIELNEETELREGENLLEVKVTAANGAQNVYTIKVVRDKFISENSKLSSIEIANHEIAFESEQYNYDIELGKGEQKLEIKVKTENAEASYKIFGNEKLKNDSTIRIEVTAQDGKTVSNYYIHVKVKSGLMGMILLGAGIALGVATIVVVIVLAKKNERENAKQENDKNKTKQELDTNKVGFEEAKAEEPGEMNSEANVNSEKIEFEQTEFEKTEFKKAESEKVEPKKAEFGRADEQKGIENRLNGAAAAAPATPKHKIRARRKNRA